MSGWYKKGNEGLEEERRRAEEVKNRNSFLRFWLKVDESARVTFLDSEGFFVYEHNLKLNGKYGNYYTCRREMDECPLCDSGLYPSFSAYFTVIDHREFETRDGKKFKNQKRLFAAKGPIIKALAKRRDEKYDGSLELVCVEMTRHKEKGSNTGDDLNDLKRLPKAAFLNKCLPDGMDASEYLKPFDYLKIFEPKSVDTLRALVGQSVVGSSESDNNGSGDIDDRIDVDDDGNLEDLL